MSIKMRRGLKADFVPAKMVSGEWAVVTDQKEVFITFSPGDCKQLMTVEDATAQLLQAVASATSRAEQFATNSQNSANASATSATNSANKATESANSATNSATSASQSATSATESASYRDKSKDYSVDAEAWAVGQRNGVDVGRGDVTYENSSKFWSEVAKNLNTDSQKVLADSKEILEAAQKKIQGADFTVDMNTGILMYNDDSDYAFHIDETTGELMWTYIS